MLYSKQLHRSIVKAVQALFYPRIMAVLFGSIFVSVFIVGAAIYFFAPWVLQQFLTFIMGFQFFSQSEMFLAAERYLSGGQFSWLAFVMVFFIFIILFIPAVIIFSSIFCSFLSSTYVVRYIARKDFPHVSMNDQSSILRSIKYLLGYTLIYFCINLILLPISFIAPPLFIVLNLSLISVYTFKISSYDILSLFLDDQNRKNFESKHWQGAILTSCMACLSIFVPLALIITPLISNVFLTYYYLTLMSDQAEQ